MIIPVNKQLAGEILGKVIFLGTEPRYEYDNDKREYTDKMLSNVVHLGCEKLADSISVQVETLEKVDIRKFAEVDFDGLIYSPYATVSSYNIGDAVRSRGVLNERFACKWIVEAGKGGKQG